MENSLFKITNETLADFFLLNLANFEPAIKLFLGYKLFNLLLDTNTVKPNILIQVFTFTRLFLLTINF